MWGSLLFPYRVSFRYFGHVVGLLIPKSWMDAAGVSEHLYHIGAVYIGVSLGIITLVGDVFINSETCYYEKYSQIKFSVRYLC